MENIASRMPVSTSTMTVTPCEAGGGDLPRCWRRSRRCRFLAMSLIWLSVTWNGLLSSQLLAARRCRPGSGWRGCRCSPDLPDDEPADQAHDDEAEDRGERGGQARAARPCRLQAGHGGLEQRGDEQRGDEGEHDQLDGADDPHQHPEGARQDQQPPAGLGGDPHAPRHGARPGRALARLSRARTRAAEARGRAAAVLRPGDGHLGRFGGHVRGRPSGISAACGGGVRSGRRPRRRHARPRRGARPTAPPSRLSSCAEPCRAILALAT